MKNESKSNNLIDRIKERKAGFSSYGTWSGVGYTIAISVGLALTNIILMFATLGYLYLVVQEL